LEVLKDGASMTPSLSSGTSSPPPVSTTPPVPGEGPLYQLRVQGLWRTNPSSEKVVNKYFDDLKKATDYFAASEDKVEVTLGIQDDRYAYDFKFRLPLVKGMKFDK
jgi:hypothetical protein